MSNKYPNEINDMRIHSVDIDEAYIEKIKRHKRKKKILVFSVALVLLMIVAACIVLHYYQNFTSYKVVNEIEHSDATYVRYASIDDLLIRYTRDGITLYQNETQVIWSATYEMQSPQVDINGDYVIVYESGFNKVYLFDLDNQLYTYETTMPIEKACVSKKGTIALLVEEDEQVHRIQYVDADGKLIADGRTTFSQKGYPLDMALSGDGYKLCISYCVAEGASIKTKLVFHSFDDIGDSSIDNIVTEDVYENVIMPTIKFMSDDSLVAFGDDRILIYNNDKTPELQKTIDLEAELKSIFYDENYFGTVANNENVNIITVYNRSGKQQAEIKTNFDYTNISIASGRVLLNNSSGWQVYLKNGYLKASSEYSNEINQMTAIGYNTYIIVSNDKIEKIRLSN